MSHVDALLSAIREAEQAAYEPARQAGIAAGAARRAREILCSINTADRVAVLTESQPQPPTSTTHR